MDNRTIRNHPPINPAKEDLQPDDCQPDETAVDYKEKYEKLAELIRAVEPMLSNSAGMFHTSSPVRLAYLEILRMTANNE